MKRHLLLNIFAVLFILYCTGCFFKMDRTNPADEKSDNFIHIAADPRFSPDAGYYTDPVDVTLLTETLDASIWYTTDGTDPSAENGLLYEDTPITVSATAEIRAIVYKDGYETSNITSAEYIITGRVADPVFSIDSSSLVFPQTISLTCGTSDAIILYTTDGTDPDPVAQTGTQLASGGTVQLNSAQIVKAIAYVDGWENSSFSSIVTKNYRKLHDYDITRQIGTTNHQRVYATTTDTNGNVYMTGNFFGTVVFDSDWGTSSDSKTGAHTTYDIFVTKINSDGSYGWTKRMGDDYDDCGYGIATDPAGNVYVTGNFAGTVDFREDWGTTTDIKTSVNGNRNIFVTKINSDGTYGWTSWMGGDDNAQGNSITADSGYVYITGYFGASFDFADDWAGNSDPKTIKGQYDIFVTCIKTDDRSYWWTKQIGGTGSDYGYSIVKTGSNIYLTGYFNGTVDFSDAWTSAADDSKTSAGSYDIFVTKILSSGETYGWTKRMGGAAADIGNSIAADSGGNVYLTGSFNETVDFREDWDTTADSKLSLGYSDIFVTKINSSGTYAWTRQIGGTGSQEGSSIAVDTDGNIYLTGYTHGIADFRYAWDAGLTTDTKTSVWNSTSSLYSLDIFVTKINSDSSYGWTKLMGGEGGDFGKSITTDGLGNVYVAGDFTGTVIFDSDWGTTSDSKTAADASGLDIFVTKLLP